MCWWCTRYRWLRYKSVGRSWEELDSRSRWCGAMGVGASWKQGGIDGYDLGHEGLDNEREQSFEGSGLDAIDSHRGHIRKSAIATPTVICSANGSWHWFGENIQWTASSVDAVVVSRHFSMQISSATIRPLPIALPEWEQWSEDRHKNKWIQELGWSFRRMLTAHSWLLNDIDIEQLSRNW